MASVAINPFTLEVDIHQFAIKENDQQPFVGFDRLRLNYQFWDSIFQWGLSISDITLDGPYAHIKRVQSQQPLRFNFSDIIETLAKDAQASSDTQAAAQAEIPHFILTNLAIVDANLNLIDEITKGAVTYPKINLKVAQFDSNNPIVSTRIETPAEQQANRYHMEFFGKHGGKIALHGQVQLSPFQLIGDIEIDNLALPQFWSFIDEQFYVSLATGYLDFNTHYQVSMQDDELSASTDKGTLALKNMLVTHDKQPLISLDNFTLDKMEADLATQSITVGALHSTALTVNAHIDQQGIDLASLLLPKSLSQATSSSAANDTDEPAAPENKESEHLATEIATTDTGADTAQAQAQAQWHARLDKIHLEDYQLNLTETLFDKVNQWQVSDISLTTGVLDDSLSQPIEYQLALKINQEASLQSQGQVDAKTQRVNAELALSKLALKQFQPYLAPYINVVVEDGQLNTQGQLQADAQGQLNYLGKAQIDTLQIKDIKANTTLLKWHQLDINRLDFNQQQNRIALDKVTLTQPYGRILITEDRSTNFEGLMVQQDGDSRAQTKPEPKPTAETKSEVAAAAPMAVSINSIIIKDGSTFFADNSLTPNFAASIEQLSGSIANLSSSSDKAAGVDIKGKIDRYAPVTLKGEINPLLPQPYLDLALSFKHVELTSVNPYSGTYAGYYIDKGLMSLDLNYQLEENQLVGDNHLVVDQLQLGQKSNSSLATSLPVTLAIALLQDRNGVIDLGLQVSGDLNEPSFSFGSIIATAFTNVITKAVTAPFSLLAGLLGSDEELDKVAFNPGQATLPTDSQTLLNKLAKGLQDRPKLTLSAKGAVDLTTDTQALRASMLHQALAKQAQIAPDTLPGTLTASSYPTSGELSDALKSLYEQTLEADADTVLDQVKQQNSESALTDEAVQTRWHIALYNYLLSAQQLDETELGTLAQQRALTVKQYLIEQAKIAPSRVFILDSQAELNTSAPQALLTLSAD